MNIVMPEQESDAAKERIYQALLQTTPDLLYVFDLQHRFIYANDALLNMWGMSWDEAKGKTCLELGYEPWHAAMHDEEIDRVVATRQPVRGDVPFPHKDKGTRIYDYIFTPVIGLDGEVEAIAGSTRDVTERQQHEQHLQLLINELNHRVKNSLVMVQSLNRQTFATATDLGDACEKFESRLLALSNAHNVLTRENWHSADILELTRGAAAPYESDDGRRFEVQGESCRLDPRRALALALALHELCSNAVRYGALSVPHGIVRVSWERRRIEGDDWIEWRWQEVGGPTVQSPARHGFGSRLLERGLKHDLGGDVSLAFDPEGVAFRIVMPLRADVAQELR